MMKHEFTEMPIPVPAGPSADDKKLDIKIRDCGEPVISMKYGPANIISDPQYFIQGLAGALPECYCREGVMLRLVRAAEMLPDGYKFVVFDGWRALKLQKSFYDEQRRRLAAADPSLNEETLDRMTVEFVSLPSRSDLHPAPHSTGGALDLSVADENGLLLPMGTKFDSDTAEAYTSYYEERLAAGDALSESDIAAMRNRRFLYHVMLAAGFVNYRHEWWHFDFGDQLWAVSTGAECAIYGRAKPEFVWLDIS